MRASSHLSPAILLVLALTSFGAFASPAWADSELVEASQASVHASVEITLGTIDLLSAVGELTVVSIEVGAESVAWVLHGVVEATGEVIELTVSTTGAASVVVGQVVSVAGVSAGWVLMSGAEVIAFVANEAAASIYHSSLHR